MGEEHMWIGFDRIVRQTEKAMLLDIGEPKPVWIPRSQIKAIEEDNNTVYVSVWFLTKEGLV